VSDPKDRILDAAETVFGDRGYRGGSLNDVAVAAGYTRAGLLHHFPNKEALLLALLDRRDARLRIWDALAPGLSLLDYFGKHADEQLTQLQAMRPLIQLGHIITAEAASPDHPAAAWAVGRERRLLERLTAAAEISRERKEFTVDVDPRSAALIWQSAFEGLEGQWLLDPSIDLVAGVRVLRDLFFTPSVR